LKASLISTETMRLASHQMRRHFEYLSVVGQTLTSIGKTNTDFVQRVTLESAEDLKRTADRSAAWTRETTEHRTQ
jgi:hypothetical protein